MSSVFTKIIQGEIPCYKIYEDDHSIAFLDINPETPGHTLVVPKNEVDKVYDLPEEDYINLMLAAKKVATHMEEVLGRRIVWEIIGVDVPHAHIHLKPFDETWTPGRHVAFTEEDFAKMRDQLAF